jgi:hypothetical protein
LFGAIFQVRRTDAYAISRVEQLDPYQCGILARPQAYREIDALRNKIDIGVGQKKVDSQIWKRGAHLRNRCNTFLPESHGSCNADRSDRSKLDKTMLARQQCLIESIEHLQACR